MRCFRSALHRQRLALTWVSGCSLILSACSNANDQALPVAVIGPLPVGKVAGSTGGTGWQLYRTATAEGLVGLDEQGHIIPALADRWIVQDDGQSYIFRLRDGKWADGSQITSESARTSLLEAMSALRGTALGADIAAISEVRTMAGRVLELRLARGEPDLLQLLAQPELALTRGTKGAGPMRPEWTNGWVALRPIAPEQLGMPQDEDWAERARTVELHGLSAQNAIARFAEGSMALVLGGGIADFPRIGEAGVSQGAIRFDQVGGLFGLGVQNNAGFLAEPGNREAIAMAVDRDGLIAAFGLGGWTPTTRILPGGAADDNGSVGQRWEGRDMASRRSEASARVAAWRSKGGKPSALRIALPGGPGGDVLFRRLSADLSAIGLSTQRVAYTAPADMRLIDEVARINRASWFLNQLACPTRRTICNPSADALAARAAAEPDPQKRGGLTADAEVELTRANVFIPFGPPIRWSLVSGSVTGFAINRWGMHPLMPLAILPK